MPVFALERGVVESAKAAATTAAHTVKEELRIFVVQAQLAHAGHQVVERPAIQDHLPHHLRQLVLHRSIGFHFFFLGECLPNGAWQREDANDRLLTHVDTRLENGEGNVLEHRWIPTGHDLLHVLVDFLLLRTFKRRAKPRTLPACVDIDVLEEVQKRIVCLDFGERDLNALVTDQYGTSGGHNRRKLGRSVKAGEILRRLLEGGPFRCRFDLLDSLLQSGRCLGGARCRECFRLGGDDLPDLRQAPGILFGNLQHAADHVVG